MSTKLVEVTGGLFLRETANAVQIIFDEQRVWVPKSQLDDHDDDYSSIVIPEWLAIEKEIEAYITNTEVRVW